MNILLIDPEKVKEVTAIDNNIAGDFLLPAIKEAQEMDLEETIGSPLYKALIKKVSEHSVSGVYKELLEEKIHPFLQYASVARLIPKVAYKVTNAGVVTTNDVNIINVQNNVLGLVKQEAISNRDVYKKRLQDYLRVHHSNFPELSEHHCDDVHKNLYASDSCPIWLGGYRSKRRR